MSSFVIMCQHLSPSRRRTPWKTERPADDIIAGPVAAVSSDVIIRQHSPATAPNRPKPETSDMAPAAARIKEYLPIIKNLYIQVEPARCIMRRNTR
jgi:hypothetical protein